ncbi:ICOS ligand-like isoform X2 [Anabas testudineus]|uniref:ICOS ligand-like isoform X2 n=1 Tax=Anabas testudineus TaxID=64144 RepID=UPI000E45B245|nr:ICOS ligand-like isoform X2 [Anabas testudineus]
MSFPNVFLLLKVSSANISINGTRGEPLFWPCYHTFSEPFQPNNSLIYWQGCRKPHILLHAYVYGKEEFQHQNRSFKNRTTIFPDQLPSRNFSLIIEPLMLQDDQIDIEVIFRSQIKSTNRFCQTTVYVAAPFQEPKIEINRKEKTATCNTKGGFPEPEIKWSSGDRGTNLKPHKPSTVIFEEDGTFSVSSTVSIIGLQNVACEVYNPTSNQTLTATKEVSVPPPGWKTIIIIVAVTVVAVTVTVVVVYIYKSNKSHQCPQPTEEPSTSERAGGEAADSAFNMPEDHEPKETVSLEENSQLTKL